MNAFIKYTGLIALIAGLLLIPELLDAQCPMCRMTAEADLKNGGTQARGLNAGILYLLSIPYLVIGIIGYLWWRNRKRIQEAELAEELQALLDKPQLA